MPETPQLDQSDFSVGMSLDGAETVTFEYDDGWLQAETESNATRLGQLSFGLGNWL
jgi:hypothetical protein